MTTETFNITEVAEMLDCESETAVKRIMSGDLPGLKFGRGWIVPREAFFQRLNAIALEEAQQRRQARMAIGTTAKIIQQARGAIVTTSAAAARPGKRGRIARTPPQLPAA